MAIIITLYITLVRGVAETSFLQGVADRLCSFDKELHIFLQKNAIDFFLFFVVILQR
jgi:hypothetical protein